MKDTCLSKHDAVLCSVHVPATVIQSLHLLPVLESELSVYALLKMFDWQACE
jgi:hypothetical protein